jgi:hypothetical protein
VGTLHAVKPKCHPLLLDSRINQPKGVALNIYQVPLVERTKGAHMPRLTTFTHTAHTTHKAFLLSAIKFYCQVKAMPRGADKNPAFFLGTSIQQVMRGGVERQDTR